MITYAASHLPVIEGRRKEYIFWCLTGNHNHVDDVLNGGSHGDKDCCCCCDGDEEKWWLVCPSGSKEAFYFTLSSINDEGERRRRLILLSLLILLFHFTLSLILFIKSDPWESKSRFSQTLEASSSGLLFSFSLWFSSIPSPPDDDISTPSSLFHRRKRR